jgi:DNA-binding IclR family transcriptional regulator
MAGSKACAVPSIDRAVRIFELLAHSHRGLSLSEISRTLGLPKSSVYLLLATLEKNGYLQKNAQTARYCFGLKLISLSRSALENLDLRQVARPFLQKLAQEVRLTVHLGVLERGEAVIIDKIEPPGLVKVATWIGRRLDVNCTGVGKALIAYMPKAAFDQQITAKTLTKHNDRSIVSIAALKKELLQVRELGYAFDDEEDEIGLRCIGAPIFGNSREVVAALSVSGTVTQIPMENVSDLGKKVRQTADAISSSLGFVQI